MQSIINYYLESVGYTKKLSKMDIKKLEDLTSRYGVPVTRHKMYWYISENFNRLNSTSISDFAEYCEISDHRGFTPRKDDNIICEWLWDKNIKKFTRDFKIKIYEEVI